MKPRYRISPNGAGREPNDAELLRYRDSGKLHYNYQRARDLMHRKPLYREPKAFLVLMLIVLLAWLISEGVHERTDPDPPATPEAQQ
ncbi:MAG: hypothetical protein IPJ85_08100 [Flavobacteriales bacterium]|nr:hypothetical protein [Flavobacteriales bacterium]